MKSKIPHLVTSCVLALGLMAPLALPLRAQNLEEAITGVARNLLSQEMDRSAYEQARSRHTEQGYRDYLQRFPQGVYATEARRTLQAFVDQRERGTRQPDRVTPDRDRTLPAQSTAAAQEDELRLTRVQRTEIQRQLTALGYDTGGADGVWGRNTRTALGRWQSAIGQSNTGYITYAQMQRMGQQYAALPQQNLRPDPASPSKPSASSRDETALNLSIAERREIQLRLWAAGHRPTNTRGEFDTSTRQAITAWQRANNYSQTGYLSAEQLRELQRQTQG